MQLDWNRALHREDKRQITNPLLLNLLPHRTGGLDFALAHVILGGTRLCSPELHCLCFSLHGCATLYSVSPAFAHPLPTDEYLSTPALLDSALLALLSAPLFTSHVDRQTANIISTITTTAPPSSLFISLMLVLHLGMSNPLASSLSLLHADSQGSNGNAKVYKAMRGKWNEVVPVLMKWVWDADVVQEVVGGDAEGRDGQHHFKGKGAMMPAEGWEERVGTAATAVLYEVCRVQRLNADELCEFSASATRFHDARH